MSDFAKLGSREDADRTHAWGREGWELAAEYGAEVRRLRQALVAAYNLVSHDEGREPGEIVQDLRENLHDALGPGDE